MDRAALEDATALLQRAHVLDACLDGPVGRSTVAERAECSRATAYRQTTALTDEGLLERTPEGYRTTGAGRAVVDAVENLDRSLSAIEQLEPLLAAITAPELVDNVHLFADADLAVATPQHPNAPIEAWLDHFESFERSRSLVVAGCPPAITRQGIEHAQNGVDFAAVCTPLALEADQNASEAAFETIATADAPSLYTNPDLPFTMGIIDEVVIVIGFDDETTLPVASVTTDDPEARAWAERLYRRYERDAEPLDAVLAESSA